MLPYKQFQNGRQRHILYVYAGLAIVTDFVNSCAIGNCEAVTRELQGINLFHDHSNWQGHRVAKWRTVAGRQTQHTFKIPYLKLTTLKSIQLCHQSY